MPFSDFHGNSVVVQRLRESLARERFPHAVILAGPEGSGKYTLALMLAQAMNCQDPPAAGLPDFCGVCGHCRRIALAFDLDARVAEALEAREGMREADKKDTRLFVQTHPDVLVVPPDPPQLMIKVDQVRHVIGQIYFRPAEARRRVFIFTDSAFMKEAANSLLKILEEPPDFATLFLLAENPGGLLTTIRSRCVTFTLAALATEEVEEYLSRQRADWTAKQRSLVARLSGGALGRARNFDLNVWIAARAHALALLGSALEGREHTDLFKITETYRAGADGREKTERLLRAVYSLLQDLLWTIEGAPEQVRNIDILPDLKRLAAQADLRWISTASERLAEVERGMRRNLLRSLSLDAFVAALEPAQA
jgi:DNA polymerase-3 subunit delta'